MIYTAANPTAHSIAGDALISSDLDEDRAPELGERAKLPPPFRRKVIWNPPGTGRTALVPASLVEVLLAARKSPAVIAEERNDRALQQFLALQAFEHLADFGVELLDGIVVHGSIFPNRRNIRIVRGTVILDGATGWTGSRRHTRCASLKYTCA
jgi:hypothetical protein